VENILEKDRKWIWHPYSQHGLNREILPVISARGAYLKLADGREILDGISSWWVNILGHSHPEIAAAIFAQASSLEHVIFSGFTHYPAVALAEQLVQHPALAVAGLSKVFYSDNGSTAVEVALKMAYQFHVNRGEPRSHFLALKNSYHGDTLGAMAVGEPEGFHEIFRKLMPPVDFILPEDLAELEHLLRANPNRYAAFIFEPLLQGAGGMRMYSPEFLKNAVDLCQKYGVLTIADEVFTGFYRTGKCFAFEHCGIRPDMICLSKGITGGFLPLAVTLVQERIFEGFLSESLATAFLHGHSYTANPIACAAALASWKVLHEPETQRKIAEICEITEERILKLRSMRGAKNARCLGTVGAVELADGYTYFSEKAGSLMAAALNKGVLLRPLGSVVYTVPPYCCTATEIHQIYDAVEDLISSCSV
jgi:adenosylmethionine-8-amino-7-oxononanoate aminotransferase